MAFVQAGGCEIVKLGELNAGDTVIEGAYLGSFETKFGNPAFKFRTKTGEVKAVACGALTHQIADVPEKSLCKIVYNGEEVLSKGKFSGKTYHNVTLYVDDNTIVDQAATEAEGEAAW